ncbi:hypothetical protein C8R44DRAFT_742428 [Mycena epipterygia]|nr:hypothetical protein C8R44DRAFT_742428 [Mycena epipterygia]
MKVLRLLLFCVYAAVQLSLRLSELTVNQNGSISLPALRGSTWRFSHPFPWALYFRVTHRYIGSQSWDMLGGQGGEVLALQPRRSLMNRERGLRLRRVHSLQNATDQTTRGQLPRRLEKRMECLSDSAKTSTPFNQHILPGAVLYMQLLELC